MRHPACRSRRATSSDTMSPTIAATRFAGADRSEIVEAVVAEHRVVVHPEFLVYGIVDRGVVKGNGAAWAPVVELALAPEAHADGMGPVSPVDGSNHTTMSALHSG